MCESMRGHAVWTERQVHGLQPARHLFLSFRFHAEPDGEGGLSEITRPDLPGQSRMRCGHRLRGWCLHSRLFDQRELFEQREMR